MVSSSRILVTFGRIKRHLTEIERNSYSQYDFSHCDKQNSTTTTLPNNLNRRSILPNKYNLMDISNGFQIYRLDISNILTLNPFVTWLPSKSTTVFGSPSYSSLYYSLIYARSEFVLFGGIEKRKLHLQKILSDNNPSKSGTLAFITLSNISL
jgi:hypothetical protein